VLLKIINVMNTIFELAISYRSPLVQVRLPWPCILPSFHCPNIRSKVMLIDNVRYVDQNYECADNDFWTSSLISIAINPNLNAATIYFIICPLSRRDHLFYHLSIVPLFVHKLCSFRMSDVLIKIMNIMKIIFELSFWYRLPLAQIRNPWPFLLSSFHCPNIHS